MDCMRPRPRGWGLPDQSDAMSAAENQGSADTAAAKRDRLILLGAVAIVAATLAIDLTDRARLRRRHRPPYHRHRRHRLDARQARALSGGGACQRREHGRLRAHGRRQRDHHPDQPPGADRRVLGHRLDRVPEAARRRGVCVPPMPPSRARSPSAPRASPSAPPSSRPRLPRAALPRAPSPKARSACASSPTACRRWSPTSTAISTIAS